MTPRQRSLAGAALAVLAIPAVLGILACLPVPIGDPEKSRIDADLNGLWLKWDDEPFVAAIEPWDKRTWAVTTYLFESAECVPDSANGDEQPDDYPPARELSDTPGYDELIAFLRFAVPNGCAEPDDHGTYRAWQTRLGDTRFMTWEPKGMFDEDYGFEPEFWYGFRVDEISANELHLWMIDMDKSTFKEFKETRSFKALDEAGRPRDAKLLRRARRALEKIVRRQAQDPKLYVDEPMVLYRIQPGDYEIFLDELVPTFD